MHEGTVGEIARYVGDLLSDRQKKDYNSWLVVQEEKHTGAYGTTKPKISTRQISFWLFLCVFVFR
jgi:hypothetical protein